MLAVGFAMAVGVDEGRAVVAGDHDEGKARLFDGAEGCAQADASGRICMTRIIGPLADVDAFDDEGLVGDELHVRIFEKPLIEFAGAAPGRGEDEQDILVLLRGFGFRFREEGVGCGRGEDRRGKCDGEEWSEGEVPETGGCGGRLCAGAAC